MSRVIAAFVSSRHHNHDARLPRRFDRLAERIELIAVVNRTAKRKVDDSNVVLALQADGLLDGGNHGAIVTVSVLIENPQVDQVYVVGHAHEGLAETGAMRVHAIAGQNARNMGAVPIQVGNCILAAGKVLTVNDTRARARRKREVFPAIDAAVDHRDPDPASGKILRPCIRSQHSLVVIVGHGRSRPDSAVRRNVRHIRIFCQRRQRAALHGKDAAVNRRQIPLQCAAFGEHSGEISLRRRNPVLDNDVHPLP